MDQNQFSMDQAMAFANSPAGQQLIKLIRKKNDPNISAAMQAVSSGNQEQAKEKLSSLLSDPQIQALLKQFGG